MSMSLEAAAQVMREAMRETVKRHSLWYLIQGGLMILAGIRLWSFPRYRPSPWSSFSDGS